MDPISPYSEEPAEYIALPSSQVESREQRAARILDERARDAQGRLALACCIVWVTGGGCLLTALPPVGDVRGDESQMTIYTPEYFIRIRGEKLHLLAMAMKEQRVDNLRVGTPLGWTEEEAGWVVRSITAKERGDD